jgi:hypothetical protein
MLHRPVHPIPGTNPSTDRIYCRILPGTKTPVGKDGGAKGWNKPENLATFDELKSDLDAGKGGFGLTFYALGEHGCVVFDIDTPAGREAYIKELSQGTAPEDEDTLSWTSGKTFAGQWTEETGENNCMSACFLLTEEQSKLWGKRKVGSKNTLDARMGTNQSVLPANNLHPQTGKPWRYINYTQPRFLPDMYRERYDKWLYAQRPELDPEYQQQQRIERERRRAERHAVRLSTGNLSDDLGDILERDILPRLNTDDIYNWGHNWKRQTSARWEGNCPNHQSKGGASFVVNPTSNTWYCNGCDIGGGAVQYRWFVRGGSGSPRGKDFVEVVRELANDAGVELPKWEPPPTTPDAREEKKLQQQADWIAQQADADFERWKRLKKFTPTEVVNQQFLDIDFQMGELLATAGGTGTGKTWWIIQRSIIKKFGFFNIGSRNTLMQNTSGRCVEAGINSYWIHEDGANIFIPDADAAIHLCIDSLLRIDAADAHGKVIVIDETISVIFHALASGTCERQRFPMLKRLDEILAVAGGVILLDANLNDWIVDDIYKRCRHLKLRKVKNEYRATQWDVDLVVGAINANGIINSGDKSPVIGHILNNLSPTAIASDSQKAVEVLSSLLDDREGGVPGNGVRVDSETTGDEVVKKFLVNPNKVIEATKPNYIAYSPTAESGLDISIPDYFDTQYSLLYWQNTDSQLQLMGRVRHCKHRVVALPERSGSSDDLFIKSHSPEAVARATTAYCNLLAERHTIGAALDNEFESLEDANEFRRRIKALLLEENVTGWESTWQTFYAMHNYERHNMQKCLQWRLEEAGHNIRVINMGRDDEASETFKLERDAVLDAKSTATHCTKPKESVDEATRILASFGASPAERRSAEKTLLLHYLPGIESTSSWTPKLVRKMLYDDKGWRSRLERFYLLQHPEISRNISLGFWDYSIKNKSQFFMPDKLKDRGLQIWALEELGILDFVNSDAAWRDDSPAVAKLVRLGNHPNIIDALGGVKPGKAGGINYLNRCLKLIGAALTPRKVKEGGATIREYKIARQLMNAQDRLDVLACIATKFEQREWYHRHPQAVAENVTEANAEKVAHSPLSFKHNGNSATTSTPDRASNTANSKKDEWDAKTWREALATGIVRLSSSTQETAKSVWSEISSRCSYLASGVWMNLSADKQSDLASWGLTTPSV